MFWVQSLPGKQSDTACLWPEGMTVEGCDSRRLLRLLQQNEMVSRVDGVRLSFQVLSCRELPLVTGDLLCHNSTLL
jgi:hypothetical protein